MFFKIYGEYISSDIDYSLINLQSVDPIDQNNLIEIVSENQKKVIDKFDNETNVNLDYAFYYKKDEALYEISNGRKINIGNFIAIDHELLINSLNYVFACACYQKKYICVHGSAVKYNNKTLLFLGQSGSGKSSLAASLIKNGGKLISEDTLIFNTLKNCSLYSSYPLIKLSDEVADFLNINFKEKVILDRNILSRNAYIISTEDMCELSESIDYIFYPSWKDKNSFKPLAKTESVNKFIESGFFNLNDCDYSLNFLSNIKKILSNSTSYEFFVEKKLKNLALLPDIIDQIIR